MKRAKRGVLLAGLAGLVVAAGCSAPGSPAARPPGRHDDLVALFAEWRAFQQPKLVAGVPDYSALAMAAQRTELAAYRRRLAAIDTTGWPVAQQVDWHIVRAELNGLDFNHRVLRPWARNPAFYVMIHPSQSDQPAREGEFTRGGIELWTYEFPLPAEKAAELAARLRVVPKLLDRARATLVGNARDLWMMGARRMQRQSEDLAALEAKVAGGSDVAAAGREAREATDRFRAWLEREAPSRTGPSGIGVANYDWYLTNVQLVPFTWRDEVALMRRELARARAGLAMEERHNRAQPPLQPIADSAEWKRRFDSAVTEYIAFLRDRDIVTLRDWMEPALRARLGRFRSGPREFFNEVNYRDPIVMRTHDYHWFDLARMRYEPHADSIRRGPLLYNMFITRTEGFATANEELMTQAGMLDAHPHGRELIYVLIAQRAARAIGDLMMHANEWTLEQSVQWVAANTPRGWLREDGSTVWGEQHLYLQQPAYGTSYLIGKIQIEQLLGERALALGEAFTLKRFMDEFNAAGLIPMSLIRWELTGDAEEVRRIAGR